MFAQRIEDANVDNIDQIWISVGQLVAGGVHAIGARTARAQIKSLTSISGEAESAGALGVAVAVRVAVAAVLARIVDALVACVSGVARADDQCDRLVLAVLAVAVVGNIGRLSIAHIFVRRVAIRVRHQSALN